MYQKDIEIITSARALTMLKSRSNLAITYDRQIDTQKLNPESISPFHNSF